MVKIKGEIKIYKVLNKKLLEALTSILPVAFTILFLMIIFIPFNVYSYFLFFVATIFLILGMGLFSLGAEIAMLPIGESMGNYLVKKRNLVLLVIFVILMGVLITITEPGVIVLAGQIGDAIPKTALIIAIAIGVGLFFVISVLRILFKIRLKYVLLVGYAIVFILVFFVPKEFLPLAFDSGGATTGPMTVPFILAFGVGIASVRGDKAKEEDSFGLVAVCSIGPILAVLLLGVFYKPSDANIELVSTIEFDNIKEILSAVGKEIILQAKDIFFMLFPIAIVFYLFNIFAFKFSKQKTLRVSFGLIYTFLGLLFFLVGANVGFLPVGKALGAIIAGLNYNWILIPIGFIFGLVVVMAEPAIYVLNKEVENITAGTISRKIMLVTISLSIAVAMALSMLRVLLGFSILYIIVPGYLIALVLTFLVPNLFSAIAFDSGGVASGPLTATFLVAFSLGASMFLENNNSAMIMSNAFGLVSLVALMPLISIQILGLVYKYKVIKNSKVKIKEEMIDFSGEQYE